MDPRGRKRTWERQKEQTNPPHGSRAGTVRAAFNGPIVPIGRTHFSVVCACVEIGVWHFVQVLSHCVVFLIFASSLMFESSIGPLQAHGLIRPYRALQRSRVPLNRYQLK